MFPVCIPYQTVIVSGVVHAPTWQGSSDNSGNETGW